MAICGIKLGWIYIYKQGTISSIAGSLSIVKSVSNPSNGGNATASFNSNRIDFSISTTGNNNNGSSSLWIITAKSLNIKSSYSYINISRSSANPAHWYWRFGVFNEAGSLINSINSDLTTAGTIRIALPAWSKDKKYRIGFGLFRDNVANCWDSGNISNVYFN